MGQHTTTKTSQDGVALARVVLAISVAFALAVVGLPYGAGGGGFAGAQETSSPTPGSPQIHFLNPSGGASGPGRELSIKNDGVDSLYHLVAWVSNVPPNPIVEFKYQAGNNPELSIGQATRLGDTDTFEFKWNMANAPEGAIMLSAILFSNNQEVARDEEAVRVNNEPRPSDAPPNSTAEEQGETVEIIYPANAGALGFSRVTGTNTFVTVLDVSFSADTTRVRGFYSKSPPGTEPAWIACSGSTGEAAAQAADGIRCTLAEGDHPTQVTAVAARTQDAGEDIIIPPPDPEGPGGNLDSGDAHRAFPYLQSAASVSLSPATQTVNANAEGDFPCSPAIVGTVLDQNGRKMAGVNVDVHAAGPEDGLFFDDSGDTSSSHQPPDSGHVNESTVNCEDTAVPPGFNNNSQQGKHDVPGPGDIKHIESVAAGTNDAGQFSFRLNNRTRTAGSTQFTMWQDRDNDDRLCSDEARGNGSIGWGTAAPTPAGVGDETTVCPEPTSTTSPTATASPTPTQTSTASPTPTQSPEPEPTERPSRGQEASACSEAGAGSRTPLQGGGVLVVGTPGDDELEGSEGDDIICGLGGDDRIRGLGGDDVLLGQGGADVLLGGPGDDDLRGGGGRDLLRGGGGNDILRGGGGPDTLLGGRGNDILLGNRGADILRGHQGRDVLRGHKGRDQLKGGKGNDRLFGGPGNDQLDGGPGNDRCVGGPGRDTFMRCN